MDGELPFLHLRGDGGGESTARWESGCLRGIPGVKCSFAWSWRREERGVHACAAALGSGVETDVDGGMGGVGGVGALVESERAVGIAQEEDGEAAEFEFMTKEAGEAEGDVFFGQGVSEGGAAFVASMGGIDDGERRGGRLGRMMLAVAVELADWNWLGWWQARFLWRSELLPVGELGRRGWFFRCW